MEEKDNDMVAIKKETFSNNDINIYIDDDSLRTSQEIVGKEFSYHVAEAEKSLVRAVSNINQCQVSLSVIGQEISYTEKILSIISNLKIVIQTLDTIHEDLMKIQSTKHEDELLNDLVKKELPEQLLSNKLEESFDDDVHDIIEESEAKIEDFEVEQDFSLCDISTEYFCILCEKYFETQGDLDVHKRLCVSKESNKCDVCQKNFRTAKILKKHRAVNHLIKKDETNSETKKSPKKGNGVIKRKRARSTKELNKVLECALCQIEFNSIEDYNFHIKTMKHGKMKIFCEYCLKQLVFKYYPKHVLTHHSGLHVCNTCDEKFDNKRDLTKHMTSKHGEDAHRCSSCVQIFSNKDQLQSHMDKDHPSKTKCQDCNKDFSTLDGLRTHLVKIHSKMLSCKHCDQEFDTKKKLYRHNTTVHNSKAKKVCQICGYIVESNHASSLWNHQQSHNEETYKCEVCNKGFKIKRQYILHARIHTGEKPYECKECGAKFRKQNMLARHRFVHNGEKPYVCNLCGRGFNQSNNLKTHMKSHIRGTIPTPASE